MSKAIDPLLIKNEESGWADLSFDSLMVRLVPIVILDDSYEMPACTIEMTYCVDEIVLNIIQFEAGGARFGYVVDSSDEIQKKYIGYFVKESPQLSPAASLSLKEYVKATSEQLASHLIKEFTIYQVDFDENAAEPTYEALAHEIEPFIAAAADYNASRQLTPQYEVGDTVLIKPPGACKWFGAVIDSVEVNNSSHLQGFEGLVYGLHELVTKRPWKLTPQFIKKEETPWLDMAE